MVQLDFDTIVVGAGIIGSGCALQIARTGRRTLLLEQFTLGHDLGSSHGASRIIRCTHSDPIWLPLALDAFKEWDKLHKLDGGNPLIIKNGFLTLDAVWENTKLRADILRKFGVPYEVLRGGQAIQKRFPHLANYGEHWSAIYEPGGGTILANNCLKAVQRQFLALGEVAVVQENEEVVAIYQRKRMKKGIDPDENPEPPASIESPNLVEVETNKGKYLAENVVVAAGGWLSRLFPELPLRARPHLIGVHFWPIRSRPQLFRPEKGSPNLVIVDQLGQELFAIPGVDFPDTIKFAIHLGTPMENMLARADSLLPDWMHSVSAQHLADHFPDVDSSAPAFKAHCVYTITDDQAFIVDSHPEYGNVFIAGGFSGTGFKFALNIGKMMAQWVNGKPSDEFDLSPFRLSRKIAPEYRARL